MNKFFEKGYQKILMEAFDNNDFDFSVGERRHCPRIKLESKFFTAFVETNMIIRDVSRNGLAVFTDEPLTAGNKLTIILKNMVKFVAVVVSCDPITGQSHKNINYKIRCVFEDHDQGVQMMITGKDLEAMD